MDYQHIIYEPGKVARIILNRPQYYNAQSWLMREEMDDAFHRAADDKDVGAIVLSGTGDHFSVGHDIGTEEDREYQLEHDHLRTDEYSRYKKTHEICVANTLRWRNIAKPTIAMVHGYCIYGGWMFAAAMDILFAAEDALFLPSLLQYFSVPWDVSPKKTKELMFEHRFMSAREGLDTGFVNRVYSRETLEAETLAFADRVAENYLLSPLRIELVKTSVNHMMDTQGFTAEVETMYNSHVLALGPVDNIPHPKAGGLARVSDALENFELTRPWLDSLR
jgi:enoyl-CoA hydratase